MRHGPAKEAALDALQNKIAADVQRLRRDEILQRLPALREAGLIGALYQDEALDIDVHALHLAFLRGTTLWTGAELTHAAHDGSGWLLRCTNGRELRAGVLVNAAGAWADTVAQRAGVMPLGLQPKRRSAFSFDAPEGSAHRGWPAVCSVDGGWYFKPDAGRLIGSPGNADPVAAHDVQAEELDIAHGIAQIEEHTRLTIRRPRRVWAGLRTFAPDGELVIGFDAHAPGFFWLAGQGGWGIQSAAGASLLAQSLLMGTLLPQGLAQNGVLPAACRAGR
jgi:D-arginine dehydrogenase